MSDELVLLGGCVGIALIVFVAVGFIATSATRTKSKCPQCGVSTHVHKAFVIEHSTGRKIEGEKDVGYAVFSAIGTFLIGIGICAYLLLVAVNVIDDSCSIEGILLTCYDYSGGLRVETTVNLLLAFVGAIGGLSAMITGGQKIFRAVRSKGKPKLCEFVCPSCKHTWNEEFDK